MTLLIFKVMGLNVKARQRQTYKSYEFDISRSLEGFKPKFNKILPAVGTGTHQVFKVMGSEVMATEL